MIIVRKKLFSFVLIIIALTMAWIHLLIQKSSFPVGVSSPLQKESLIITNGSLWYGSFLFT